MQKRGARLVHAIWPRRAAVDQIVGSSSLLASSCSPFLLDLQMAQFVYTFAWEDDVSIFAFEENFHVTNRLDIPWAISKIDEN